MLEFLSENHKNDNQGGFLDFNDFTLYMIFSIFLKIANRIMAIFREQFGKSFEGWIRDPGESEIPEFLLFSLKIDHSDLKINFLKFYRNSGQS